MKRHSTGFTLMELLVVLFVGSVVTGLGTVMFHRMTSYWGELNNQTELNLHAAQAFETLGEDFAGTLSIGLSNHPLIGDIRKGGNDDLLPGASWVMVPVAVPTRIANRTKAVQVIYNVKRDGGRLERKSNALYKEWESASEGTVIAEGVVKFRIEYLGVDTEWVTKWDGETLPRAVRVSLTLGNPENPLREQVSRVALFPIRVE